MGKEHYIFEWKNREHVWHIREIEVCDVITGRFDQDVTPRALDAFLTPLLPVVEIFFAVFAHTHPFPAVTGFPADMGKFGRFRKNAPRHRRGAAEYRL